MRYVIDLPEDYVEALYEAIGLDEYELDDEVGVEEAIKILIEDL